MHVEVCYFPLFGHCVYIHLVGLLLGDYSYYLPAGHNSVRRVFQWWWKRCMWRVILVSSDVSVLFTRWSISRKRLREDWTQGTWPFSHGTDCRATGDVPRLQLWRKFPWAEGAAIGSQVSTWSSLRTYHDTNQTSGCGRVCSGRALPKCFSQQGQAIKLIVEQAAWLLVVVFVAHFTCFLMTTAAFKLVVAQFGNNCNFQFILKAHVLNLSSVYYYSGITYYLQNTHITSKWCCLGNR